MQNIKRIEKKHTVKSKKRHIAKKKYKPMMQFFRFIPLELERKSVDLQKYNIPINHLCRIPSDTWIKAVSNGKDIILTNLKQISAGEVRDQEYFLLLLMPKQAYVIFLSKLDNINKNFYGKFCLPCSFEYYDIDMVTTIMNDALIVMNDRGFRLDEDPYLDSW